MDKRKLAKLAYAILAAVIIIPVLAWGLWKSGIGVIALVEAALLGFGLVSKVQKKWWSWFIASMLLIIAAALHMGPVGLIMLAFGIPLFIVSLRESEKLRKSGAAA